MKMIKIYKTYFFLFLFYAQAISQNSLGLDSEEQRIMKGKEEIIKPISKGIIISKTKVESNNSNSGKDKSIKLKKQKSNNLPDVNLSVVTIPKKAVISMDGKIIGKTPLDGKKITPGFHNFFIEKGGYAPISYDLNVNPSKSIRLDFFMNPVYEIKFKTNEVGLIFELNNEHRWTDNFIGMQLEAGDHKLRVFKFDEIIDEQVIVADQPLTFHYYLKRGPVASPTK